MQAFLMASSMDSVEEPTGQVNVMLSDGAPLVLGLTPLSLSTTLDGDNQGFKDINVIDVNGNVTEITSRITGGKLRGLLNMRDTELVNALDKLDRLAAAFIQEFNRVHEEGIGADGSTGVSFFSALTPVTTTNADNTGSATISASNVTV